MTFDLGWLDIELLSEEAHAFQLALLGREQEAKSLTSFLRGQLEAGEHGGVS